jgi:hypothetical protein
MWIFIGYRNRKKEERAIPGLMAGVEEAAPPQ